MKLDSWVVKKKVVDEKDRFKNLELSFREIDGAIFGEKFYRRAFACRNGEIPRLPV